MSTTTVRDRMSAVRTNIRAIRDERAELTQARDEAKSAFLAAGGDGKNITSSREFKTAKAAADRLDECDRRLQAAQDDERAVLGLLAGDQGGPSGENGPSDIAGHLDAVQSLTRTPGALLASILERRKGDVATLPENLRFKASMSTPATTGNISTITETDAVIDLLTPQSVAVASGIPVLPIDTTKMRVPRFTSLPQASWIPELGAFPTNGPGVEMVDVDPPKVGLITEVAIEVFEDLRPLTMSMLQIQLLRAVALKFDAGILFGDGTGATPRGVAYTTGIGAVAGVPLTNLAAFAEAIADLIASNAKPGALAMHPLDIGKLLKLTEASTGYGSNVPLWKASIDSASGLRLPYFNTPIWPTPAAPQGTALLYDPAQILIVLRRPADISIDPYYGFNTGVIGLRTYLRGDVVVGQPAGAVKITFAP